MRPTAALRALGQRTQPTQQCGGVRACQSRHRLGGLAAALDFRDTVVDLSALSRKACPADLTSDPGEKGPTSECNQQHDVNNAIVNG